MLNKKELRRKIKQLELEFLASGKCFEESERILNEVSQYAEFLRANYILLYMSIDGEVITEGFINYCLHIGKRVVLPKVNGDDLSLRLFDRNYLIPGYKGILEPSDDSFEINTDNIDLAIIPGIAFAPMPSSLRGHEVSVAISDNNGITSPSRNDKRYYRLGRGGGFYDRLLPKLNCPIFAVAYPFRILDSIPIDEWDLPVDKVFF